VKKTMHCKFAQQQVQLHPVPLTTCHCSYWGLHLVAPPLLSPPLLVSRANLQQSPQAWATTKLQILLHTPFFVLDDA
jgi:hypothetical protein